MGTLCSGGANILFAGEPYQTGPALARVKAKSDNTSYVESVVLLDTIKGEDLRAHRDRALLAIGMSAALRRSEIVAFTVSDVGLVDKGIELMIARSKTDQAREGVIVAIPEGNRIRPKALLLAWMAAAGHADGFLFRRLTR
jgi:hypothetical protein